MCADELEIRTVDLDFLWNKNAQPKMTTILLIHFENFNGKCRDIITLYVFSFFILLNLKGGIIYNIYLFASFRFISLLHVIKKTKGRWEKKNVRDRIFMALMWLMHYRTFPIQATKVVLHVLKNNIL